MKLLLYIEVCDLEKMNSNLPVNILENLDTIKNMDGYSLINEICIKWSDYFLLIHLNNLTFYSFKSSNICKSFYRKGSKLRELFEQEYKKLRNYCF